MHGDTAKLL